MAILKWGKPSQFQKAPANTPLTSEYVKTADTALVTGKEYYTESSGSYSAVTSPTAGSLSTYYEKAWKDLALPKEGTLQLQTQQGQENKATEEGGDVVDIRYGKDNYNVQWDEFDRDDVPHCFDDVEGVVEEETALRWLPEDASLKGVYIPRAKARVTRSFNTSDGAMRQNQIAVLKPAEGLSVQEYAAPGA